MYSNLFMIKLVIISIIMPIILFYVPTRQLNKTNIFIITASSIITYLIITIVFNNKNNIEQFKPVDHNRLKNVLQKLIHDNDHPVKHTNRQPYYDYPRSNNLAWGHHYDNDMMYNELPQDMMQPLGKIDTSYTYMPPWKWWPPRARPPVCVSEKKCQPCPVTTTGTPTDVKDWDNSRHITPGLGINIPYIQKLNEIYNTY